MIRTLDPGSGMLLANLRGMAARMQKAQREISSGLKVNTASDAPDQVGDILALRAALMSNEQIRTNLERSKSEAETADAALDRVVRVLDRAISVAAAAAGSLNDSSRAAIAEEVKGLEEQLVALSRTAYGDRYLFSGDLDREPSYRMATGGGIERLISPTATRQVQHPCGVAFTVSKTAQEIFDHRNPDDSPSGKNVFAAISGLRTALEAGDGAGIEQALGGLRAASAHVNAQMGFYGAVQNRIAGAITDAGKLDLRLKTALGERCDADPAASIMELQQAQLNQSAAMQARGMVPRRSLFEYLR